jgi:hypothetical protein
VFHDQSSTFSALPAPIGWCILTPLAAFRSRAAERRSAKG